MIVTYNLVVDFARPSKSNLIIISEGDSDSRLMHFTLLSDKQPMSMTDVASATVRGVKPDGSAIYAAATIVKDSSNNKLNEIEYTLPAAFSDTAGRTTMTITLTSTSGASITSFEWYVEVRNALFNEDDYISSTDLQGYKDLMNRCLAALEKMEAMTEHDALPNPYALNITVEDTTYAYNGSAQKDITIKDVAYLADKVSDIESSLDESSAASAAASATAAANSKNAAAASAASALAYRNSAEEYKNSAQSYATNASNSAGLAQGYASQFSTQITTINTKLDALWEAVFPSTS